MSPPPETIYPVEITKPFVVRVLKDEDDSSDEAPRDPVKQCSYWFPKTLKILDSEVILDLITRVWVRRDGKMPYVTTTIKGIRLNDKRPPLSEPSVKVLTLT